MGIFDWLFGNIVKSKRFNKIVKEYKINDNMPASNDTVVEGHKIFKRDITGLSAYFKEMPNMERIFNELTHQIRNGHTVKNIYMTLI